MDVKTKPAVNKSEEQIAPSLSIEIYKEICNNIRVSDEISFKLLNIIPVLSGIGSTGLIYLEKSGFLADYSGYVLTGFSICGGLITFGLYKWELRNVQKCNLLIKRAGDFESRLLRGVDSQQEQTIQFANFKEDIKAQSVSSISDTPWGKTQAEKLIYSTAIAVWFIPLAIGLYKSLKGFYPKIL